ncbi:MAG: glycosyltransferase family 2 protein [Lachnospiraceae bacterium]|nr:glycosyltransferase family 2 protein [Lachnospiraceae bacterium]
MNYSGVSVSVIIAIYNAEKYLKRALDSLMQQTHKRFEIIFVEDGSTDDSKAILARYSAIDDRIRVLHQPVESHNASRAFNMGIDHARGEYLLLLNDYDIFEPDLVEKTINRARETGSDIVLFDAYLYDEETDSDRYADIYLNRVALGGVGDFRPKERAEDLYSLSAGCTWNMLISRHLLDYYNIRLRDLDGAFDLEFSYMALSCASRVSVLYERLVHNRRYAENNHRTRINEWPETGYMAYFNLKEELKKRSLYETYRVAFVNKVMTEIEDYLKRMTDSESFLKLYGALQREYLYKLGTFEIRDEEFATRHALLIRNAIKNMAPMEYLLNAKDDVIERERDYFRLPFERDRNEGVSVAIFGADDLATRTYYNALKEDDVEVVCWTDFDTKGFNPVIRSVEEMKERDPDYIIVVNPGVSYLKRVKQFLRSKGVDTGKVVSLR